MQAYIYYIAQSVHVFFFVRCAGSYMQVGIFKLLATFFTPFPKLNAAPIFSLLLYFTLLKTDVSTLLCGPLR